MSKCKKWLLNWIKLQQKGGGITPTGECEITENGVYDVTEYATADVNVSGDVSDYFMSSIGSGSSQSAGRTSMVKLIKRVPSPLTAENNNLDNTFNGCVNLLESPEISNDTTLTSLNGTFSGCTYLATINVINTSNVTDTSNMCRSCLSLVNFPLLDGSSMVTMTNMFVSCNSLSSESMDNILRMCISATNASNKTLSELGFTSAIQAVGKWQALPHYQDFLDAGWVIGYGS